MKAQKSILLMIFILILIIIIFYIPSLNETQINEISSFEECAAAGFPVMESYPRQCMTSDGRTFVEDILIGGQRDEHGCLSPAGYTWNETDKVCVREWEKSSRNYINTNTEECDRIQFLCVGGYLPFYDSTGCGCELESTRQDDVCKSEDRKVDACIEIYQPVCGWFNPEKIVCVKYPCAITFSNSCFACMDETILYYTGGECPE